MPAFSSGPNKINLFLQKKQTTTTATKSAINEKTF